MNILKHQLDFVYSFENITSTCFYLFHDLFHENITTYKVILKNENRKEVLSIHACNEMRINLEQRVLGVEVHILARYSLRFFLNIKNQ